MAESPGNRFPAKPSASRMKARGPRPPLAPRRKHGTWRHSHPHSQGLRRPGPWLQSLGCSFPRASAPQPPGLLARHCAEARLGPSCIPVLHSGPDALWSPPSVPPESHASHSVCHFCPPSRIKAPCHQDSSLSSLRKPRASRNPWHMSDAQ